MKTLCVSWDRAYYCALSCELHSYIIALNDILGCFMIIINLQVWMRPCITAKYLTTFYLTDRHTNMDRNEYFLNNLYTNTKVDLPKCPEVNAYSECIRIKYVSRIEIHACSFFMFLRFLNSVQKKMEKIMHALDWECLNTPLPKPEHCHFYRLCSIAILDMTILPN